jgi:methionyl-tRNA synthetase
MSKFFLTTPIYYVNARPHVGHAYTTIVGDVLARRHRLLGDDTFFLTGTDEHGQKIERSAAAAGIPPQQFTDQVSAQFRSLWDRMGLTYDKFIRTTSDEHKRGAQKLFAELYERGYIYLSTYTGSYCVSDEAFVDLPAGTPCPDCGRPLETVTEENFFFKLSEFQEKLIALIEAGEDGLLIQPDSARNEVLSFLRGGLKDLSVSRSSFTWGIPVPEPAASTVTQKHVIYVWLDALANYMTAIGYGSDDPERVAHFERYWPADLHLVGKEITRFHCVYWPAMLMAAGLATPKRITANGWLLFDNAKMSKSKGNVVRTETILDGFGPLCPPVASDNEIRKSAPSGVPQTPPGDSLSSFGEAGGSASLAVQATPAKRHQDLFATDVLRYYLLREIPFGQDGSFSFEALITRYNADLANGYGNLVSRTLNMIQTYCDGCIPQHVEWGTTRIVLTDPDTSVQSFVQVPDAALAGHSRAVIHFYEDAFARLRFALPLDPDESKRSRAGVTDSVMFLVSQTDGFITLSAPWKLAKQEGEKSNLHEILYVCAESIRIITALLYPILPYATASVWRQLGLGDIEAAARNGELKNLQWGGLKPGTRLGPLAPIFPRADKGLEQIMIDMESPAPLSAVTSQHDTRTPATDDLPVAPIASDPPSHDPAAGPRTSTLAEPNPGAQVGGSASPTTVLPTTGTHSEAAASGIFAASQPPDGSPQISIDDFAKVELRVAQVLVCERIPKADKLLRLEVDLGYEKRQILSGIAEWYTPEDLIGRRIVVITNLAPRKMRGLESHGMLLAASSEGGKPALATFLDSDVLPLGSRLK